MHHCIIHIPIVAVLLVWTKGEKDHAQSLALYLSPYHVFFLVSLVAVLLAAARKMHHALLQAIR
jgi:hypothetical protein